MADTPTNGNRPVSELVQELSQQTSTLVRKELELARLEMTEKGKRAGVGAGLFGGAGVMAFYGGAALIVTIVLVLAEFVMDAWIAALVVTAALFLIAGVLALSGKKKVEQVGPAAPEETIQTTKQAVETVKARAKHG